jgi:DNA repair protein RadC
LRAASLIPGTLDRRQVLVVDKVAAATQVEAAEVIVAHQQPLEACVHHEAPPVRGL